MPLRWLRGVLALLVLAPGLRAQEVPARGEIKKVDADRGTITIASQGKDQELPVVGETRILDVAGNPLREGLRNEGFKEGAPVAFRVGQRDGRTVLVGLKLVGRDLVSFIKQAPPPVDMSAVKPLSDMAKGEKYRGFEGGLYPGGTNRRPPGHEEAGRALARQIRPLDREGHPAADGKIVLLGVGMSNTMQAMSGFLRVAGAAGAEINPKVVIVNGANGGMTADKIQHLDGGRTYAGNPRFVVYWEYVDECLSKAGVARPQVQAAWIKQADPGPDQGFPGYAEKLQAELANIMRLMHDRFPNLKLVYLSNRTYGGWAKTRLNPEPYAYESGFAVKWLIEQQLKGDPELNHDARRGPVRAPWLSWGPDLWANGPTPRGDGFRYEESDFRDDDRTHESIQGQDKVGKQLLRFFETDSTTRGWFAREPATP